jgi:ABC-type transport system involved in multi-copper enzyme maturation permease subunit
MPIHDRAYLRMEDRGVRSRAPAFLAVARFGVRYVRKAKLFWFFVAASWIPALIWTVTIYTSEETGHLEGMDFGVERLAMLAGPEYRKLASDYAMIFLQIQAFAVTFVAALTGGGAIAEDTRRNAFEVYFSRPISWGTYLAGKWSVVFSRLLLVLLYPMLFVFVVAFAFLPGFAAECWPVAIQAAIAAAFMSACYALVVLGVSSTVRSTRYAVVFWFILAFFTVVLSLVLVRITGDTRFEAVSFRFSIEHVAAGILRAHLAAPPFVDPGDRSVGLSATALAGWLALSGVFLVRRLRAAAGG